MEETVNEASVIHCQSTDSTINLLERKRSVFTMAKGRDKRKVNDRTKAQKSLKEKRKAKKEKSRT